MKIMIRCGMVSVFFGLLAVPLALKADTLINNFTSSANYVAGGIINETNWDGVYLNSGDIFRGTGAGTTTIADANISNQGYLTTRGSTGNWAGATDSSFFLYKVVQGDFDVSVDVGAPFVNSNYHLPGVMARIYNPNNSGSPYSITTTNASENWIYISRWEEFGGDIHGRFVTNNVDRDGYCSGQPSDSSDIATVDRYLRITRVGDTFTLYEKTNQADAWFVITNSIRTFPEWHGLPMMVGIHDETGTGTAATTFFSDFELTGTNVTFQAMPPHPSALVTTATNTSGSLTFSWTPGAVGDSSLVVMTRGRIQHNPVNGMVYYATNSFGDNSSLLDGAGEYVVYNGTGNSVTVSNMSANIFNYNVAVFEYTNNGTSTVYNTASVVTNGFPGPGVINSIYLSANSTNLPVGGATSFRVLAAFSTGTSNFDQTVNSTWVSSDPTVASVDSAGAITGVTNGSAIITATLGTFTASNTVVVTGPFAFVDTFSSTNDYVANGLIGSVYDGLFMNFGDVPGGAAGADGPGFTVTLNSQNTTTNGLYMSSVESDWDGAGGSGGANDDGPFLFKIVPGTNQLVSGDFQAVLHIQNMNTLNGSVAGLMARQYNPANAGPGPGGRENHVNYWKVQNGTTSVRRTLANTLTTVRTGPSAADGWMLIQRQNSTNFYFYEKATAAATWIYVTNIVLASATNNAPMEVGPAQQSTLGVNGVATYNYFAVDAAGLTSATPLPPAANSFTMAVNTNNLSMTLKWVAADGSGNPVASMVVMRQGAPVSAQPPVGKSVVGNSVFGSGSNLGGNNYVVFVSANPPASTNNTVTVTGLTVGQAYYATVYTYAGSGSSTVINPVTTATGSQIDAAIVGISTTVPGGIPNGGIGTVTIMGVTPQGALISLNTSSATYLSSNTNIVQVLKGVLTGISLGTANVQVVLGAYTNNASVTVRPPSFTDDFTTPHDYLVDGVTNTGWEGLYNGVVSGVNNPVPGSTYNAAGDSTSVAANNTATQIVITATNIIPDVSTNYTYVTNVFNVMTITASGNGWEGADVGGFFLFKYVPANFQMAVHIFTFNVAGYNQPGILARGYAVSNGVPGWPLGYVVPNTVGRTNSDGSLATDTGEYWVDLARFDEFNIGSYVRQTIDGGVSTLNVNGTTQSGQTDQGDGNFWLLIVRSGDGSQFDFYKRVSSTNAWAQVPNKTHYSISQLAGRPMQVGLMAGPWGGGNTVQYDRFMLDAAAPVLFSKASGGNVNVSWPAIGSATLKSTPSISPPFVNWQTVTVPPVLTLDGFNQVTMPATNSAMFFELAP
jgi:hypothetical protein